MDEVPKKPRAEKTPKSLTFENTKVPLSDVFDDEGLTRREAAKNVSDQVKEFAKTSSSLSETSDHTLRAIIHMSSFGIPFEGIARQLQIPRARVKRILEGETIKKEIYRIQTEIFEKDAHKLFMRLVPAAVNTIYEIMTKKMYKESTRLDAAKYLTDRALGKPKETLETKDTMLSDILGALHKQNLNTQTSSKDKPGMDQVLDAEWADKGSPSAVPSEAPGKEKPADTLDLILGSDHGG